jgi:hypothetical protein
MGVGYTASALHLIAYLVVDEAAPYTTEPPAWWPFPLPPNGEYRFMKEPARFQSPSVDEIVAWRDRLATAYQGQLGERLSWDEASQSSLSEDAAVSADLMLRYVAAKVDEGGARALRGLVGAERPPRDEIHRALHGVDRRGFTGRFPQLSLVVYYWLPFQRNLIIEEPDWRGKTKRFGSVYRLADEVGEIRAMLLEADARCAEWTAMREVPTQVLWAAWQASETVAKICAAAAERRLPAWTTG